MAKGSGRKRNTNVDRLAADIEQLELLAAKGSETAQGWLESALHVKAGREAFKQGKAAQCVLEAADSLQCPDGDFMFSRHCTHWYATFLHKSAAEISLQSTSRASDQLKQAGFVVLAYTMPMSGCDVDTILEVLKMGQHRYPHNAQMVLSAARMNMFTRTWEACLECLQTAQDLDPQLRVDLCVIRDVAMCYLQINRYKESLRACQRFLKLSPFDHRDAPVVHFIKAHALILDLPAKSRTPTTLLPALAAYKDGQESLFCRLPLVPDEVAEGRPGYLTALRQEVCKVLNKARLLKNDELAPGVRQVHTNAEVESMLRQLGAHQQVTQFGSAVSAQRGADTSGSVAFGGSGFHPKRVRAPSRLEAREQSSQETIVASSLVYIYAGFFVSLFCWRFLYM